MRRAFAPVLALLLVLTACSSRTSTSRPGGKGTGTATSSPGEKPSGSGSVTGGSSTPGSGSGGSGAGSGGSATYSDDAGPGGNVHAILAASPARKLIVEVDWVNGMEPAQSALDHLGSVLRSVVDKPGGVSVRRGHSFASSKSSYSIADIRAIEARERKVHSGGDTVTIWVVYLDGEYSGGQGTLGITYSASAAAIFRDQLNSATTALVLEPEIERAVLTHEIGHVLALVNIGYKSARNHEDTEHPHHSSNKNSVMYWQVEDVSIASLLSGGPPSNFDDDDRADLEQLKAG